MQPCLHPLLKILLLSSLCLNSPMIQAADVPQIHPEQVLSVVTGDWNDDGAFDRALLVLPELDSEDVDLLIYLSDAATTTLKLAVHKVGLVWVGGMWGTQPSLSLSKKGSLIINSANESIGRNRWNQKIIVAYRNSTFLAAGYTYSAHDTTDPSYNLQCDVNLLTGKGKKNGKVISVKLKSTVLADFALHEIESACQ